MTAPSGSAASAPAAGHAAYFPALDGLRCLAFLLVFTKHAAPKTLPLLERPVWNAWCGVDVFFTLSGFLVTYLLLREERRRAAAAPAGGPARFSLWRFWMRRLLRIWPLYFLVLALAFLVLPRLDAPWTLGAAAGSAEHAATVERFGLPSVTFLLNWAVIDHGVWPPGALGPLWSISIEEQFYVLWPLALFLLPAAWRVRATVAIVVLATAAKAWAAFSGASYLAIYLNSFLRCDTFLCGALVAYALDRAGTFRTAPRWAFPALLAGAAVLAYLPPLQDRGPWTTVLGYVLLDVVAAGAVWLALAPGSAWGRVLGGRIPAWLGRISYGLYCFHVFAILIVDVWTAPLRTDAHTGAYYAVRFPAALVLTLALATVSWFAYERWFLKLKTRFA